MRNITTVKPIISAMLTYNIFKTDSHNRLSLIEDEFAYASPFGERFSFVLLHDGTPERFVKDFRALLNTMVFRPTEYEQDIKEALTRACSAAEQIVKGA